MRLDIPADIVSTPVSTSGTNEVSPAPPARTPVTNITFSNGCVVERIGVPWEPTDKLCPVDRTWFSAK